MVSAYQSEMLNIDYQVEKDLITRLISTISNNAIDQVFSSTNETLVYIISNLEELISKEDIKILVNNIVQEVVINLFPEIEFSMNIGTPPEMRMGENEEGLLVDEILGKISLNDIGLNMNIDFGALDQENVRNILYENLYFIGAELLGEENFEEFADDISWLLVNIGVIDIGIALDASASIGLVINKIETGEAQKLNNLVALDMDIAGGMLDDFILGGNGINGLIDDNINNFITVVPQLGKLPVVEIKEVKLRSDLLSKYLLTDELSLPFKLPALDWEFGLSEGSDLRLILDEFNEIGTILINNNLPLITEVIGAIPIPSIMGYSLEVKGMWIPEGSKNYIGIGADLIDLDSME